MTVGTPFRHAAARCCDPVAARMAGCETIILRDAVLVPAPFAVLDADGALQAGTSPQPFDSLQHVVTQASLVAALEAGETIPLGRFLGPVLSLASMQHDMFGQPELAGAPLTPPQTEAMAALGLLGSYRPMNGAGRIDRLLVTGAFDRGMPRGAELSRLIRPAIETLRFAVEPYEVNARLSLMAPPTRARFGQRHRQSVDVWLVARRFTPLDPDRMRIGDTGMGLFDLVAVLAAARLVVIDDPVQAPLLGFCDPGTAVIELGVDGQPNSDIALCARLFGLGWSLVVEPPDGDATATGLYAETDTARLDHAITRAERQLGL